MPDIRLAQFVNANDAISLDNSTGAEGDSSGMGIYDLLGVAAAGYSQGDLTFTGGNMSLSYSGLSSTNGLNQQTVLFDNVGGFMLSTGDSSTGSMKLTNQGLIGKDATGMTTVNLDSGGNFLLQTSVGTSKMVLNSTGLSFIRKSDNKPLLTLDGINGSASFAGSLEAASGTFVGAVTGGSIIVPNATAPQFISLDPVNGFVFSTAYGENWALATCFEPTTLYASPLKDTTTIWNAAGTTSNLSGAFTRTYTDVPIYGPENVKYSMLTYYGSQTDGAAVPPAGSTVQSVNFAQNITPPPQLGVQWTASVYVTSGYLSPSAPVWVVPLMIINCLDVNGVNIGTSQTAFTNPTLAQIPWTRLSTTLAIPVGTNSVTITLTNTYSGTTIPTNGSQNNGTLFWTAVQLEYASAPTAFIDGNQPNCKWNVSGPSPAFSATRAGGFAIQVNPLTNVGIWKAYLDNPTIVNPTIDTGLLTNCNLYTSDVGQRFVIGSINSQNPPSGPTHVTYSTTTGMQPTYLNGVQGSTGIPTAPVGQNYATLGLIDAAESQVFSITSQTYVTGTYGYGILNGFLYVHPNYGGFTFDMGVDGQILFGYQKANGSTYDASYIKYTYDSTGTNPEGLAIYDPYILNLVSPNILKLTSAATYVSASSIQMTNSNVTYNYNNAVNFTAPTLITITAPTTNFTASTLGFSNANVTYNYNNAVNFSASTATITAPTTNFDSTSAGGGISLSITDIADCVVTFVDQAGYPTMYRRGTAGNVGLRWEGSAMASVNGTTYQPMHASSFTNPSSIGTKTNITPLATGWAAAVIKAAPASRWFYTADTTSGLGIPEPHIGPMVEDLNPDVVSSKTFVDLRDMIGVLWSAVSELLP